MGKFFLNGNSECLLDPLKTDQVCSRWFVVPLAWNLPAGPLAGMTALRLRKRSTCFGNHFREAEIGRTGQRGYSLVVGRMASNESPLRHQDGENVARTSSRVKEPPNTREYVLREFGQIFLENRLVLRDVTHAHMHNPNPCSVTPWQ